MTETADLVAGVAVAVGLVGIVVPVLPGTLLLAVTFLVWAAYVGGAVAWGAALVAVAVLATGTVLQYAVPGRRLKASGVSTRTLVLGGVAGVVGFFVVPVVGLFLGFVLGVYLAELRRVGADRAWPATKAAVRAALTSMAIELGAGLVAAGVWVAGAATT